jgi:hypothetical protein
MDVWTLGERLKDVKQEVKSQNRRLKHVEEYLAKISRGIDRDEVVQSKQDKPSSVRSRRRSTKKSKNSK